MRGKMEGKADTRMEGEGRERKTKERKSEGEFIVTMIN